MDDYGTENQIFTDSSKDERGNDESRIISLEANIMKSLYNYFRDYNFPVSIMVNYKVITFNNQAIKIYMRTVKGEKDRELEIGCYEKNESGRNEFRQNDRATSLLLKVLLETKILGNDLGFVKEDINLVFDNPATGKAAYNENLRFVNISQNTFLSIMDRFYTQYDPKLRNVVAGVTLSQNDSSAIFSALESYFMENYMYIFSKKVEKHLSRCKAIRIKSYYIFNIFIPVFIQGPCIINPLLDCNLRRKSLEGSMLLKYCEENKEEYRGLIVKFCSLKELSDSLNFKKTIVLENDQVLNILFGLYNESNYPNKFRMLYMEFKSSDELSSRSYPESESETEMDNDNTNGSWVAMSKSVFDSLSDEDRKFRNAVEVNSYTNYCTQIANTNRAKNKKDINIVDALSTLRIIYDKGVE